jgi:lipoprotein-anchoring transpeptidase ErfK/SrfK
MEEQPDSGTRGASGQDGTGAGTAHTPEPETEAADHAARHGRVDVLHPGTPDPGKADQGTPDPGGSRGGGSPEPASDEGPGRARRRALLVAGAGVAVAGGVTAAALALRGKSGSAASAVPPPPTTTTVPPDGATGVDPSKPVTAAVRGGKIDSVSLTGPTSPAGSLSAAGDTWACTDPLHVNASYRLEVAASNSAGEQTSTVSTFHTLAPTETATIVSVAPPHGSTVGVGQPIRVEFSHGVPAEYRAELEKACVVSTDPPVVGAWYWVSNDSGGAVIDWRPENFWPAGTKASIAFNLNGVRLGDTRFGVTDYPPHRFSIRDTDLRLIVDKGRYQATCYQNGKVIRTFPIDTGVSEPAMFITFTGTMAVLGKGNPVEMKGNYGPGDTYDEFVNWATQITASGTYIHAAPWDGAIGYANDDSHGCIHLTTADAEWFYGMVQPGDVVTVTGGRSRPVDVGNGMCTFSLDWPSVLKGSAYGATINGAPASTQRAASRLE